MDRLDLRTLLQRLHAGDLDRRSFIRRATAAGMTAAAATSLVSSATAQDSSPAASPAAGDTTGLKTREDYQAELDAAFPFEEPASEGGQLIHVMTTDIQTLNTVLASDLYSGWI